MDLSNLDQWANIWLVTFNPSKTDVMLFTNHLHYDIPSLLFGESILSFTNTHKHLGVTLQSSGKWDVHIDEMISKTMKMIGVLCKMKFVLSRRCLDTMYIYIYIIRPVLEYACVVLDSCSAYNANRLQTKLFRFHCTDV